MLSIFLAFCQPFCNFWKSDSGFLQCTIIPLKFKSGVTMSVCLAFSLYQTEISNIPHPSFSGGMRVLSRVSDVCPRVNHRVNQVMKIYSGKM